MRKRLTRSVRRLVDLFVIPLCQLLLCGSAAAQVGFSIVGPGVDPNDFRMTTFATGLNYPVGMSELSDGSILVAVSNGSGFFGSSSGQILRLADTNNDGVADQQDVLVNSVPGGGLSALRVAGDLVFTTGQGRGKPISIYRLGDNPTDPLTEIGHLTINYPGGGWLHPHSALAVRPTPDTAGSYDLLFQLGSQVNFATTTQTISLTSDIGVSGNIAGDAIHKVTIVDNGQEISGTDLSQIATGLRNAAGMAFHPVTGDLYLQDNGIDGLSNANEPHSADELNVIGASDVGGAIDDFGFPNRYVEYRTGNLIGSGGIDPLVAFQPIPAPNGDEGEGPNDIAFAPPGFPDALSNGVFVGMHGKFSLGGTMNEENPLVFVNLNDNSYFHIIQNDEPSVGHLDGLLATNDSLFVADISPGGGFGSSNGDTGRIYQIKSLVTPTLDCDFDGTQICDLSDLDMLMYDGLSTQQPMFDLDDNGAVNLADRDIWLAQAGTLETGNSFVAGDTNLNGRVDAPDLNALALHWLDTGVSSWAGGDFDGNGVVNATDLNQIGVHWQHGVAAASPVPEPGAFTVALWCWGVFCACVGNAHRRRKK